MYRLVYTHNTEYYRKKIKSKQSWILWTEEEDHDREKLEEDKGERKLEPGLPDLLRLSG